MAIWDRLRTILTGDADVSALVSTRVYPLKLPQNPTYPALTYFEVASLHFDEHDNQGPQDRTFQISVWSDDIKEARDLADKVRIALQGHASTGSPVIHGIVNFTTGPEIYEEDTQTYQIVTQCDVWHT